MLVSVDDTTGYIMWPSSQILSRYILYHQEIFRNKIVAELGCGTGICGIVASTMASFVVSTDGNESCRYICETNAALNGLESKMRAMTCRWGDISCCSAILDTIRLENPQQSCPKFDVVIASDVLYQADEQTIHHFWKTILCMLEGDVGMLEMEPLEVREEEENESEDSCDKSSVEEGKNLEEEASNQDPSSTSTDAIQLNNQLPVFVMAHVIRDHEMDRQLRQIGLSYGFQCHKPKLEVALGSQQWSTLSSTSFAIYEFRRYSHT